MTRGGVYDGTFRGRSGLLYGADGASVGISPLASPIRA